MLTATISSYHAVNQFIVQYLTTLPAWSVYGSKIFTVTWRNVCGILDGQFKLSLTERSNDLTVLQFFIDLVEEKKMGSTKFCLDQWKFTRGLCWKEKLRISHLFICCCVDAKTITYLSISTSTIACFTSYVPSKFLFFFSMIIQCLQLKYLSP